MEKTMTLTGQAGSSTARSTDVGLTIFRRWATQRLIMVALLTH